LKSNTSPRTSTGAFVQIAAAVPVTGESRIAFASVWPGRIHTSRVRVAHCKHWSWSL